MMPILYFDMPEIFNREQCETHENKPAGGGFFPAGIWRDYLD